MYAFPNPNPPLSFFFSPLPTYSTFFFFFFFLNSFLQDLGSFYFYCFPIPMLSPFFKCFFSQLYYLFPSCWLSFISCLRVKGRCKFGGNYLDSIYAISCYSSFCRWYSVHISFVFYFFVSFLFCLLSLFLFSYCILFVPVVLYSVFYYTVHHFRIVFYLLFITFVSAYSNSVWGKNWLIAELLNCQVA